MKIKFKLITAFILLFAGVSNAQTGIGTLTPDSSSVLDVYSDTKGLLVPRLTTTQRNNISNPAVGLTIYNTTKNCLEWYNGIAWYNGCGNQDISVTSNGTAVVSSYSCATGSAGTLNLGIAVSGVTQTITATVTMVGTYNISASINGVTFEGFGTFTSTGNQNIVLTATGTPTTGGSNTFTLNTTPNCSFSRTVVTQPSTNGTAVVSGWVCSTASAGTMTSGTAVTGVTQTITATVTTIGSYSISTTTNGVTFAASGTFTGTGAQAVVLTATGTPTAAGAHTFTLNTTPNCSFSRSIIDPSTNGSGGVSSYTCNTGSAGNMTAGTAVSGVTQTITATVTTLGTYSISSVANGVTFAASGTFTATGAQNIVLTATGTPTTTGIFSYTLNTNPNCSFTRNVFGSFVSTVCASTDSSFPTTKTISGRSITITKSSSPADGGTNANANQCTISSTGSGIVLNSGQINTYTFSQALKNVQIFGYNNESTENNEGYTVSAFLNGVSVPVRLSAFGGSCIGNFTITQSGNSASIKNTGGGSSGIVFNIGSSGNYDSITVERSSSSAGSNSHGLMFCNATSVNEPSTNGSGIVSSYSCDTATSGTMTKGIAVSGVTQTITATVVSVGSYNITSIVNGVTFTGSGTFTSIGAQNIVLTATGTPTASGTSTFTLNTTPNCSFNRVITDPSSNGSATVTSFSCSTASAGSMTVGTAVSGVTQTITATVTTVGTYNISATANGVTFAGTGTFTGTGAQNVVLTATGIPTAVGSNTFTLNTTPNCNFSRSTFLGNANGTANVSSYNCTTGSTGTMTTNTAVSGVTQTITAIVTTAGTYNISATANGVTFAASGTFAATGAQNIVLTATGTPTAAGSNTFTLSTTPNCSFTRTVAAANLPLPANITLSAISPYFIASVYDQDYLPYTAPSTVASLSTIVAVNGVNETVTLNIQGSITTTGVTIKIPYTVVNASVNLPAFTQTITIPADFTQDGISRNLTFSYNAATYAVGTGFVNANLKAVGGTLNAKQLDIQTGIGSDALGWLMGQFTYALNSAGTTANFEVRDIAGIPDRNIADAAHVMFYLPVTGEDGRVWLNNNLGADYSNTGKATFNLAQQATSSTDYSAYGSHYQWGRYSDGHELSNWTSSSSGSYVNGTTSILSTTDTPANSLFITAAAMSNWRSTNNFSLWQGVSGGNNPCPIGYRLPTEAEFTSLCSAAGITNNTTAASSTLRLSCAGARISSTGARARSGLDGYFWNSTVSRQRLIDSSSNTVGASGQTSGYTVRCIKD